MAPAQGWHANSWSVPNFFSFCQNINCPGPSRRFFKNNFELLDLQVRPEFLSFSQRCQRNCYINWKLKLGSPLDLTRCPKSQGLRLTMVYCTGVYRQFDKVVKLYINNHLSVHTCWCDVCVLFSDYFLPINVLVFWMFWYLDSPEHKNLLKWRL